MKSRISNIQNWLTENPEYIDIIKRIIEYERHNKNPDRPYIDDTEYDSCWEYDDVGVSPQRLYQMSIKGIVEKVFDSNSATIYTLSDRDEMVKLVGELGDQFDSDEIVEMHDFPSEEELEDMGVFDDVVGYEDVKFVMRRAMSSEDIVNIVLFGPPGSAKTVFLMCINKLSDSVYVSGEPASGPGIFDEMFDKRPRYMAIDELDNMEKSDQKALADYTSEGILVETKGNNKRRKMRTNTHTFAAANRPGDILNEIQNRFIDLHFEPYEYSEYVEVVEHILPKNEGKSKEEARAIADAVWEIDNFGNVRKAIQAARLSDGDPEKVLGVLDSYSESRGKPLLG